MATGTKKSETLQLRLPHALKARFMARCEAEGRAASDVLRHLIEGHLAPPQALETARMTPRLSPSLAALGVAGAAVVALATAVHAQPDPDTVFRSFDANRDGALTMAEVERGHEAMSAQHGAHAGQGAGPHAPPAFRTADVNNDGALSLEEFRAAHARHGGRHPPAHAQQPPAR